MSSVTTDRWLEVEDQDGVTVVRLARQDVQEETAVRLLGEYLAESVRQGSRGWIDDDLAFTVPWGFELAGIETEVGLWQGELDVLAPRAHGEYVASELRNSTFRLIPGAGHMMYDEWPAAFDWLVDT